MDDVYEVAPAGDAPRPDLEAPLLGRSPKINHHPDSEDDCDPEVEEQRAKLLHKYKRSLSNPKDELR